MAAPVRLYKRNPMASIRGWARFKKNMQELAKVSDTNVMTAGFVGIAEEMKSGMDIRMQMKFAPETDKYRRWKASRVKKRKGGSTYSTSLRNKGVVAKKFGTRGKNISFVAINYKYAPHNWWIEHGTAERHTKSGRYTGRVPAKKFEFFRPTVDQWRRSGRYVKRVEGVVRHAVDAKAKGMVV
jgi:hypothetical protein